MQEQTRPDRLVEYLCTVGLSSPLTPLLKDGLSFSTPIHSLCLVANKDEPPPSHTKLELCYYAEPANLNAGNPNFLSPSIFLCVSRTPSSSLTSDDDSTSPITDVIILYPDKNEKPPPGYQPVILTGNHHKSTPYGRSLLLAYTRAGKRPLLDVVLCEGEGGGGSSGGGVVSPPLSPSPPCKVPPHYVLLKKSVAMGAFHHSTFLAVLPSPTSLSSLPLRSTLLDRYPRSDLPSSPLPDSLPYFSFPEGALILPSPAPPTLSTFVLTQPSGLLLYCSALTLYEPCHVTVTHDKTKPSTSDLHLSAEWGVDGGDGYTPKCVVLLSYYPYYRAFTTWLQKVHSLLPCAPCSIEKLILNLWETPLPRPSHQSVALRLPTVYASASSSPSVAFSSSITFVRPSSSSLPITDFSFLPLFTHLSLNNVILVVTAMLNEKKIILYSSTPSVLTPIASSLLSLLFPLQWTSPYVPILPALSSPILDSPFPVLLGVDGRYALHRLTSTDDACVVDCDQDEVRVYGKVGSMSEDVRQQLKKELQAFAGVEGKGVREEELNQTAMRACFLHLFVGLLGEVDDALLFPSISADREPSFDQLFDLQSFLAAPQRKGNRSLLKALCSSQLFSHYIEEKTYSASADRRLDLLFFDECVRYEAEVVKAKGRTVPLITRIMQQKDDNATYLVPLPDIDPPTSSPAFFRYPTWPQLDPTKMGRPRPVTLKYVREALVESTPLPPVPTPRRSAPIPASSPLLYAKSWLRDLYAIWFELWSICLPTHPSPPTALLTVWTSLARMTKQGVEPDVGIYHSVLSICGRWRKKEEAALIFETMRRNGVKPSSMTYGAYTSALAEGGERKEGGGEVREEEKEDKRLHLDPYRLAADKHKRLILRAQRQRIVWSALSLSIGHQCQQCWYEMSEGEVLAAWLPPASPACQMCHTAFIPQLSIFTPIITHPPRLKSLIHSHLLHRPLSPLTRHYHITVPRLSPSSLRLRFLSACSSFRDDLLQCGVMRVMHHVVYWNLVYYWSQPYREWDLTFVVEGEEGREGRVKVRRRKKGEEEGEVKRKKERMIKLNEGLRERQQGEDVTSTIELNRVEERQENMETSSPASLSSTSTGHSLSSSLSIDTDLTLTNAPLSSLTLHPAVTSPSPTSPSPPLPPLTIHPSDHPIEQQIIASLSKRQLTPALELFLKHRQRTRPQHTALPSTPRSTGKKGKVKSPVHASTVMTPSFSFDSPSHPHQRSSLSKSHSFNEVETMRSLSSVTSLALNHLRAGNSPFSPPTIPPASHSPPSFLPLRDAGPSIPLHLHSMFDVMYQLGAKGWEGGYGAFCENYDRAVEGLKGLSEEVTMVDRAPRVEVRVVEVVLGLRKEKNKKKDKPPGSASKKRKEEGMRGLGPLTKSASSAPLRLVSSPSISPVVLPITAPSPPPVSVSFPIAYPVSLLVSPPPLTSPSTPATPSSRSIISPEPSTPPPSTPPFRSTPFTPSYEPEVFSGSLSTFIGTPDTRGMSPSTTPSKPNDDELTTSPHMGRSSTSTSTSTTSQGSRSPTPSSPLPSTTSPRSNLKDEVTPTRMSRSISQPDHAHTVPGPGGVGPQRLSVRAGSSTSGSGGGGVVGAKSFGQSLYQFLMTKPTGFGAAAAGRGGGSFTAGTGVQGGKVRPAAGGGRGHPKKVLSSGHLDNSAKRREEKEKESQLR